MKGSIRFIIGLLVTWIAAGSMDTASDLQLLALVAVAALGLYTMYSGARALQQYQ
jgi:hypothetical protein